jgi:hypothetical protein
MPSSDSPLSNVTLQVQAGMEKKAVVQAAKDKKAKVHWKKSPPPYPTQHCRGETADGP